MKLRTKATYQFLKPLTDAQYEALRADIAANGMRHPIVVDGKGLILDGHHRAQVAQELGIEPVYEVVGGLSEQEKRDLVFTLNGARRHMDSVELREFVVRSLMADPQLSDRQHARRTGVSHPTVAKLRGELEAGGQLESLTSRVGADGRERPATRPSRPAREFPAPDEDQPDSEPAEGLTPVLGGGGSVVSPSAPEAEGAATPSAGDSPPPASTDRMPKPASSVGGSRDPDPRTAVRDAMDRHLPADPDEPYREWRKAFLAAIGPAMRLVAQFPAEAVIERADDECVDELRRMAQEVGSYYERVRAGRPAPDNVRHLRAV